MNTHRHWFLLAAVLLLTSACDATTDSAAQTGDFEVKVTENGNEIASYKSAGAVALLQDGTLSLELLSPDDVNWLTVSTAGQQAGVYPLSPIDDSGAPVTRLYFVNNDRGLTLPFTEGQVNLTERSGTRCSGTFSGTLTSFDGKKYTIEGAFSDAAVVEL